MEWRKVKNIIILILLLVNGFLLVIVGARRDEVRRYEQSAVDQAIQVLETNGIQVSEDAVAAAEELKIQTAERSISAEERLAEALLGETVSGRNQGGGLYSYQGGRGTVYFRAGGQIFAQLEQDSRWHTTDPEALVRNLLGEMKIDGEVISAAIHDDSGEVTVRQTWQKVPLFSCQVRFEFDDGYLRSISGTLLSAEESVAESGELLTLPTALMTFLDEILSSGDICTAVTSMEPGYRMTQSYSSTLRLEPVWLISSDTAEYYLDAVTGELSRLTGE